MTKERAFPKLGSAILVVALVSAAPSPSYAANGKRRAAARALVRGTFVDGPKHTVAAIRKRPVKYTLMLAGIGLAGATARKLGVNPEPYAIAASAGTLVYQFKQAWPAMRRAFGANRWRSIGANVLWPTLLASGTTAAGLMLGGGHGHGEANAGHATVSLGEAAKAGAQSVAIGIDAPTILQGASDH